MRRSLVILIMVLTTAASAFAQTDRKEVRQGNRDFKKGDYQNAEIDYKKALLKDTLSNAANFNLANTYYRMENYSEADKYYSAAVDSLDRVGRGAEGYFNQGDSYLQQRNWQAAIEAFKNSLRRNPDDMDAKSNLAYAQKMLSNDQNGGGGQNQNQNQENQNNDQNQDQQNQDQQDQNNNQNQDQQDQNQNQDQQNQDQQNQDQQDQNQNKQQSGADQPKISPQAAQQMLQAIQDQEKQTQDKVNKEKAAKLKSKQKDKNW